MHVTLSLGLQIELNVSRVASQSHITLSLWLQIELDVSHVPSQSHQAQRHFLRTKPLVVLSTRTGPLRPPFCENCIPTCSFLAREGRECECRRVCSSNAGWSLIVGEVEPLACGGEW